jgi:hypothetical protein
LRRASIDGAGQLARDELPEKALGRFHIRKRVRRQPVLVADHARQITPCGMLEILRAASRRRQWTRPDVTERARHADAKRTDEFRVSIFVVTLSMYNRCLSGTRSCGDATLEGTSEMSNPLPYIGVLHNILCFSGYRERRKWEESAGTLVRHPNRHRLSN